MQPNRTHTRASVSSQSISASQQTQEKYLSRRNITSYGPIRSQIGALGHRADCKTFPLYLAQEATCHPHVQIWCSPPPNCTNALGKHGNTPRQMEVEHPSFHRENCSYKDDACVRFKASYLEGEGERESAQAS